MPKRPLPTTYLLLSIVTMAVLHFVFPVVKIIPFPWNLLAAIPFALGLALNLLADRAFKKHDTTVKPFEESTALATTGVFQVSRNPMYLGFVLILVQGETMDMRSVIKPFTERTAPMSPSASCNNRPSTAIHSRPIPLGTPGREKAPQYWARAES